MQILWLVKFLNVRTILKVFSENMRLFILLSGEEEDFTMPDKIQI